MKKQNYITPLRAVPVALGIAVLLLLPAGDALAHGKAGKRLAEHFEQVDADGNGKLSAEEILAAREDRALKRITKAIARHDTDSDGLLDREEIDSWAKRNK